MSTMCGVQHEVIDKECWNWIHYYVSTCRYCAYISDQSRIII